MLLYIMVAYSSLGTRKTFFFNSAILNFAFLLCCKNLNYQINIQNMLLVILALRRKYVEVHIEILMCDLYLPFSQSPLMLLNNYNFSRSGTQIAKVELHIGNLCRGICIFSTLNFILEHILEILKSHSTMFYNPKQFIFVSFCDIWKTFIDLAY